MINVGIIGLGFMGATHIAAFNAARQAQYACEIVAVCDISKERADKAAERYGCPGFYAIREMLARGIRIDAASMCTAGKENGGDHYEPTMQLLRAGVPVLGEKPISNELPKAREMVALAKEKNLRYGGLLLMADLPGRIFIARFQALDQALGQAP